MRSCEKQRYVTVLAICLVLTGSLADAVESPRIAVDGNAVPRTATPKSTVSLTVGNWSAVQDRVAQLKGQIVVVDAWSTACPPCLKEFPHFVALHRKYSSRGVKCISFNCDYDGLPSKPAENYREQILKYLKRQEATSENFLNSAPLEKWLDQIDLGSIPAVFVFGRDGKLVRRFDNDHLKPGQKSFTYADVTKLVEQLLPAAASPSPGSSAPRSP